MFGQALTHCSLRAFPRRKHEPVNNSGCRAWPRRERCLLCTPGKRRLNIALRVGHSFLVGGGVPFFLTTLTTSFPLSLIGYPSGKNWVPL